jgi:Tol biopolymer transport system component
MLVVLALASHSAFAQQPTTVPEGDYLGQPAPGLTKKVFAPGLISTDDVPEGCMCFSPDGDFLVFRRHWRADTRVYLMERKNGRWSPPEVAPFFDQRFSFGDFTFAPSGKRLYFTSNRPIEGREEASSSSDIWMVEHVDNVWQRPAPIGAPVSSALHDSYPAVDNHGTIYFFRRFEPENGASQILTAELVEGSYSEPVVLGDNINTEWDEWDPAISPDGSTLVFCSKKPSGMGVDDLYVSFKGKNGQWSESMNLGDAVNTSGSENRPHITADGKYLIFNSDANGSRDLFWIDMEVVRRLQTK